MAGIQGDQSIKYEIPLVPVHEYLVNIMIKYGNRMFLVSLCFVFMYINTQRKIFLNSSFQACLGLFICNQSQLNVCLVMYVHIQFKYNLTHIEKYLLIYITQVYLPVCIFTYMCSGFGLRDRDKSK